jgi:hypothetical protein
MAVSKCDGRILIRHTWPFITSFFYIFLRDFYNTVFALDFGLLDDEEISYQLLQACEFERNNPGKIQDFFNQAKIPLEIQNKFLQHPKLSMNKIQNWIEYYAHPELIEVVGLHHEKQNGEGFPSGLYYSAISDFETWMMFCDNIVSFDEHIFVKNDGKLLVRESLERAEKNDDSSLVPIKKIVKKWIWQMQELNRQDNEVA